MKQKIAKVLIENRKASFEYFIEERYEAGIVLLGSEVKSIRRGMANMANNHVVIRADGAWLSNFHVSPYKNAVIDKQHDQLRYKKLLLHKHQIAKIYGKIKEKGLTCVATKVYCATNNKIKVEIAIVRGKQMHDKREAIKARDLKRDVRKFNYDEE